MMYYVEKTFRVPIGHRLSKHEGLCQNYHGHNFIIKVKLRSEFLNDNEMVIDFSDLKDIVNEKIIEPLDHCLVLNIKDESFSQEQLATYKTMVMHGDPTAEKLAEYVFKTLDIYFHSKYDYISVHSVKVWENEDSCAEYTEE